MLYKGSWNATGQKWHFHGSFMGTLFVTVTTKKWESNLSFGVPLNNSTTNTTYHNRQSFVELKLNTLYAALGLCPEVDLQSFLLCTTWIHQYATVNVLSTAIDKSQEHLEELEPNLGGKCECHFAVPLPLIAINVIWHSLLTNCHPCLLQ